MRACARRPQRGMMLVAVMWAVAALALLAGALASTAKSELGGLAYLRGVALAEAHGDTAIAQAVLALKTATEPVKGIVETTIEVDGVAVAVRLVPVSGLIDLNIASEELLTALFSTGGGVSPEDALILARRVLDWRDPDNAVQELGAEDEAYVAAGTLARPRNDKFLVIEDLMQVLGMSYDVFERVRPYITVSSGIAGVDPSAAPAEVLTILAGGNQALGQSLAAGFAAGDPTLDQTGLDAKFIARGGRTQIRRAEARVPVGDGRTMTRVWWVDPQGATAGAPWRVLRREVPRIDAPPELPSPQEQER